MDRKGDRIVIRVTPFVGRCKHRIRPKTANQREQAACQIRNVMRRFLIGELQMQTAFGANAGKAKGG